MTKALLRYYQTPESVGLDVQFRPPRVGDAGFDLPATEKVTLAPGSSALVSTGLHLAIPEGFVGLVRDRSSVAMKGGVTAAGVIDASYRGEVKVLLYNLGQETLTFSPGERIAQCVVVEHLAGEFSERVESLEALGETPRGAGGFGSTGR